jgi:hypothetical protein
VLAIMADHIEAALLAITADHIEVARRRSSVPNIPHLQWLSTARGTRHSARRQFAILHASTEVRFFHVNFVTRVD